MRWGTRVNIWKTPTYLNGSKCVFCPSCQAGLPETLTTWKRGGDHFYNYLFSLKKLCLALIWAVSQVKVLLPGVLSSLPVWILHVLPEPVLASSPSSSSADGPGPQQSLFLLKCGSIHWGTDHLFGIYHTSLCCVSCLFPLVLSMCLAEFKASKV